MPLETIRAAYDYKQLVTTPTGLKEITRWVIKKRMLG
jgi:hypothetical protein